MTRDEMIEKLESGEWLEVEDVIAALRAPAVTAVTISAEQAARDMLERMGYDDAQERTSGDLIELANLIADRAPAVTKQPTGIVVEDLGVIGIDFDHAKDQTVAITLYPEGTWGWSASAFGQSSHGRGVPLPLWAVEAMRAPAVTGEADHITAMAHTCAICYHALDSCSHCAPPAAGAPPADEAIAREIMTLLVPLVSDAAIVGRTYGWAEVLDVVRAVAVKFAAGAPPALVALVLGYREACAHYNAMQNKHEGDWLHSEVVEAAKRVEALHAQIRWHWSPAPAPVAPPAETCPRCRQKANDVCGHWWHRACQSCACPCHKGPVSPDECVCYTQPAPPAVAGGDAPSIDVHSFTCECGHVGRAAVANDVGWRCAGCGKVHYVRRRQEGQ